MGVQLFGGLVILQWVFSCLEGSRSYSGCSAVGRSRSLTVGVQLFGGLLTVGVQLFGGLVVLQWVFSCLEGS